MPGIKNLYDKINDQKEAIRNFAPEVLIIPQYISNNLKHEFFDWQKQALENLLFYENEKTKLKETPSHLMFNMATGTGKTLIMAACILFYYKQGYRNFIFFVNQNNIVDKTENNFIDSTHNKYLFKEKIIIDDKTIKINKVDVFSDNTNDIEIKFTTIQKLYNDIHLERENQIILNELNQKNIVMLADEAHHLNADTRNENTQLEMDLDVEITGRTSAAEIERKGWEHTVINLIWGKNNTDKYNRNILLEFTATIPDNEQVAKKYSDKIIYKFGLKEFLAAGYTKEINLISSTFTKKERILQALLFNWYREKIALKYYSLGNDSLVNFKPVVLFRSKTIDESNTDYEQFLSIIRNLQANDFHFLNQIESKINENSSIYEQGQSRTRDVLKFIKKENISYSQITEFIRYNFAEKNCIITNSKTNTTKTEKTNDDQDRLLNSLEDKNNHIRAIFTVERLTEGWDVLNLFDIVRLYQGQNAGGSTRKTPEATTKEKQLIGRGVRYYPFSYQDKLRNKRKFDENLNNELRVLEELYYYTYDEESRYISHLKEELRKDGYIRENKVRKTFSIKREFQDNPFFDNVKIWKNNQMDNPYRRKKVIDDIAKDIFQPYKIKGLDYVENQFGFEKDDDKERLKVKEKASKSLDMRFKDFDKHLIDKAINIKAKADSSIFQFAIMEKELEIESMEDLIKDEILGKFRIPIIVSNNQEFTDISNQEKLNILLDFLDVFSKEFKQTINPKIGTEFKEASFSEIFGEPKTKAINKDDDSERITSELEEESWYVLDYFYGTDQEKELINEIKSTIENLKSSYEEVYLLRNEEVYKIYDFDKGRGFQPDFILFLKKETFLYYQVFIEPKGEHLKERDDWKDKFLKNITEKYGENDILEFESKKYRLIGLPLFNNNDKSAFATEYKKLWID